jgi:hypothetical protein
MSLFSDNFNRANSSSIGNGWTDNADSGDHCQIVGNLVRWQWVNQPFNGVSHGFYRDIGQHKNLKIEFTWVPTNDTATVDGLLPEVRVLSNGSGENGYGAALLWVPQTDDLNLYILDGGTVRANTLMYGTVSRGTTHNVEILIDDNYWVEIRIWRPSLSESRPSSPNLSFNNSGSPYTPSASGSNFMMNAFHGSSASFSVTVNVDDLVITDTTPNAGGSTIMLMGLGI